MQKSQINLGRVLYASGNTLYLARGAKILQSSDCGTSWKVWASLPVGFWQRLAMQFPFLLRLLRLGIHHLTFCGEKGVVIANKASYLIEKGRVHPLGPVKGSRPMVICSTGDAVYYGEYRSNPERSPVHIYRLDTASHSWTSVWRFEGVRHVHGVFYDSYDKALWVTTGDDNNEASIWRSDDQFQTLQKVVGGTQQLRAVQLLFSYNYIYFGSDTPDEPNFLYRMDRSGKHIERLQAVNGSVFYGCIVGRSLFFSTAVEPSTVNTSRSAEVWRSDDGVHWFKIFDFKKDSLSMKYFQYGQVLFPNECGQKDILYCSPFATQKHGTTLSIDLSSI